MNVLVTGARGAIGSACVNEFVSKGHHVFAQDLDAGFWEGSESVTPISGSLLDESCLAEISALTSEHGLSAVVAAHGIAGSAALADCTEEFVNKVLAVNWDTIPLLFGAVQPQLARTGGAYVVIASQAALIGEADNAAYCAAKFAVNGWVEEQAKRTSSLTVHALCPGATNSALLMAAQQKFAAAEGISAQEYYDQRAAQIAVGRYGEPEEIAAAAAFLATPGPRPTIMAVTGGDVLL